MDINTLGIGALIGAVVVSGINIFISWRNKEREDIKERLENLYLPLDKILKTYRRRDNKYETFLEIETIYRDHEHLASPTLSHVLYDVLNKYDDWINENLSQDEIREKIESEQFINEKDISRDIKALLYNIYGVVDAGTFELLRQYRGGFEVHFLNFIQFFSFSPYSAKEWKRKYLGYKETY